MLPKFDYFAPESLPETFSLLATYGKDARPLAGGTDLLVSLRGGQEPAKYLIDLKRVKELQNLSFNDKSGLTVGAGVTLNRLVHHDPSNELPNSERSCEHDRRLSGSKPSNFARKHL